MSRFLSDRFKALEAYVPGEQPKDMKYIKLNTNESPFPPSGLVYKRICEEIEKLELYPDPEVSGLKQKLADFYGVLPENIFISNGSDEILNFSFMAFCDKSRPVVFPDITYGFYKVFADLYALDYEEIPLSGDFTVNISDYTGIGKNIVIANPNAPTGLSISLSDIEKIVSSNPGNIVIIDEAYVDFGGESAVKLTKKYNNLLVVMTYSKSRSMAGARLGFGIGSAEIIKDLEKIKYSTNPYNINRLTIAAGEAALDESEYYSDNCKKIIENREYTANKLKKLGFEVLDSKANFLFARSDKIGGKELYLALKSKGILARHFEQDTISQYNRITIGTKEQMDSFIKAVCGILGE